MSERPIVLCVDDNPQVLASVSRSLRFLPVDVLSTSDPREALTLLSTHDIAVLVSDLEMPDITGIELTAATRRLRPETIRILLTGCATFDAALAGINEGEVFRYLVKPLNSSALRVVVSEALDRHHEISRSQSIRERESRRRRLADELEAEFPQVTQVLRGTDGVYTVGTHVIDLPELAPLLGLLAG